MKKSFGLILLLSLSTAAFAGQIECRGKYQGRLVKLKGTSPGPFISQAKGSIEVDGTEAAQFEAGDMSWNMLDKSFKFENSQGDSAEGKFDNYMAGLVTISKLEVRGQFSFSNVKVKCKTK